MREIASPYNELLNNLLSKLKDVCDDNLVSLVLYGSIARNDYRKDSDIDILLIFEELPIEKFQRQRFFIDIEKEISFEELYKNGYYPTFSPILKTKNEAKFLSPLYIDMVEDAIILFDKESFFQNILKNLKTRLDEIGAVKKKNWR